MNVVLLLCRFFFTFQCPVLLRNISLSTSRLHEKPTSLASPEKQVQLSLCYNHLELDMGRLLQFDTETSEGRAASVLMAEHFSPK